MAGIKKKSIGLPSPRCTTVTLIRHVIGCILRMSSDGNHRRSILIPTFLDTIDIRHRILWISIR